MAQASASGTLFLIVGPSGAGKDTLIDGARTALADSPRYRFARRIITRPADAGGEAHQAVSPEAFGRMEAAGTFAFAWGAHDLRYGIPHAELAPRAAGVHVVANVSRGILDAARAAFPPVRIVSVIVPTDVLRARLLERGRESPGDVERRLARAAALQVTGPDVRYVVNDRSVADGVALFLDAIGAGTP